MKVIKSNSISAFGGMNFVFEYLDKHQIGATFNKLLPVLPGQSKYSWKDIFYSLSSIYLCGGNCIEDLQVHLKDHFHKNPFVNLPSSDTVLRRLSQLAEDSNECETKRGSVKHTFSLNQLLLQLNFEVLKRMHVFEANELTLDYDNTIIFNEKVDSKMTYKRDYGYQPGVCTVNEEQVLYIENRNGNSDAKSFQLDTLNRIFTALESNNIKKATHFRADAASYQYDVIKLLDEKVENFYIGCRNSYVEKYYSQIHEWEQIIQDGECTMEVGSIDIIPFQQKAKNAKSFAKTYRLVVKRKKRKDCQLDLITQDPYEYWGILTNNSKLSCVELAMFYNHRGNMEKQFDILKNDFGWNQMPFSYLNKNHVFLYFTAICRNLFKHIITYFSTITNTLKPTYRIKTFIFRFIILPAKWINQGRQLKLRVFSDKAFVT